MADDRPTHPTRASETVTTPAAPRGDSNTELRAPGYEIEGTIGRGGMGEVVLARDRRIGREVAIKRMLVAEPTGDEVALFLREARIQARLDHPAIVPVFEIGYDDEGRPYFTMKRLTGITLLDLLAGVNVSTQRLLRAFVEVCLAIDRAHAKNVIHRDLKPANVMLGDYGEVYVLDWGIAQVIDDGDDSIVTELSAFKGDGRGTPGYMAPEQAHGAVSPAADVYSLGCILFELLVREPLVPRNTEQHTRYAGSDSPARRGIAKGQPVPPELDALCTAAVSLAAVDRPTARALADGVQRYLDGDRDVELRRSLAATELKHARTALTVGDRAIAMQAGGAALALDPSSRDAAALVSQLMLQPPADASSPPELRAALADADADDVRRHARRAAVAYLLTPALLPLALLNGVESWPIVISVIGLALVLSGYAWWLVARPHRGLLDMVVYAIGNAMLVGVLTRVFGPFTAVPALACQISASMTAYPVFARRSWLLISIIAVGWAIPIGLELAGWVSPTWSVSAHGVTMFSPALALHGATTSVLLFVMCLAMIVIAGYMSMTIAVGHLDAKHKLVRQAWQLRQLLPPMA